jgi:hypothetical protein
LKLRAFGTACGLLALSAAPHRAFAHAGEGGFVLLLPTEYYRIGGTAAVAATFLLFAFAPRKPVLELAAARIPLFRIPAASPIAPSLLSFAVLALLIWRGLAGTQDPLANPLPLIVWTLWWVGLTFLTALLGDIWPLINPWSGPYRLLRPPRRPLVSYPEWLAHWPAVALYFGFAWFELVDVAPSNPERLAIIVAVYWAFTFAAMTIFGEKAWLGRAEPFSLFFRLIALVAPLECMGEKGERTLSLIAPGSRIVRAPPLPVSGVFFALLVLASVSFDGLSKTFAWLGANGINPLEFPGRSAVIGQNTIGLLGMWVLLALIYMSAVRLGWTLGSRRADPHLLTDSVALSLIPIALAYHLAHYLTLLLVNGQYLAAAILPLDIHVATGFLGTYAGVRTIWNIEAGAIVLGHVIAIAAAHAIAIKTCGDRSTWAEFPIALVMVLYTLFGLWLLSTPSAD